MIYYIMIYLVNPSYQWVAPETALHRPLSQPSAQDFPLDVYGLGLPRHSCCTWCTSHHRAWYINGYVLSYIWFCHIWLHKLHTLFLTSCFGVSKKMQQKLQCHQFQWFFFAGTSDWSDRSSTTSRCSSILVVRCSPIWWLLSFVTRPLRYLSATEELVWDGIQG